LNTLFEHKQDRLIRDIEEEVRITQAFIGKDALDDKVMQAMRTVPRERFVPEHLKPLAQSNGPLPIGHNQTISQPYIVALMTDLLELKKDDTVLEIGTGSGYQTAVLSLLAAKVYSLEFVPELGKSAAERLKSLNYLNVETRVANGYAGWSEHAPFDAIIVTAAATHIPPPLFEQLKPGGRMVIPVGLPGLHQELMLVEKDKDGNQHTRSILGVAFVPLVEEDHT
jgi:protein-L-isoaspartate(D-aspartate) O-methyltransferase